MTYSHPVSVFYPSRISGEYNSRTNHSIRVMIPSLQVSNHRNRSDWSDGRACECHLSNSMARFEKCIQAGKIGKTGKSGMM